MKLLGKEEKKPRGYKSLYRQEVQRQKASALSRRVKEEVREDLTPRADKLKRGAKEIVQSKNRVYSNLSGKGSFTVRKDALSRLKKLGS
jgi:hypothetical protein